MPLPLDVHIFIASLIGESDYKHLIQNITLVHLHLYTHTHKIYLQLY